MMDHSGGGLSLHHQCNGTKQLLTYSFNLTELWKDSTYPGLTISNSLTCSLS